MNVMEFTFTKKERLNKKDFQGIKWKKYRETDHFILLLHNNNTGIKRLGVSIKKAAGCAVKRNKMKRLAREFFRLNKYLFNDNKNHLIRIKTLPQKLTHEVTFQELHCLLSRNIQ
ncbi:MAG: Ribonuclease P protein component [Deltaproteobacteria bacterium ADurb.Bin026]|jgi:ribonuclease P protein component|nr:Ribonuclease P protein component [Syntrophorhabdaceae bacterium]OQC47179.1 MAG: Ribonuclease P protein component [Deltaproteobacteria bacterium ADurb.Bin026]